MKLLAFLFKRLFIWMVEMKGKETIKTMSIISYLLMWISFVFWLISVFFWKNEISFYITSAGILCFAFSTVHFHNAQKIENKEKELFEKEWERMTEEDEELD